MSDSLTSQELSNVFSDIPKFAAISGAILEQYFKNPGLDSKYLDVKFKDSKKSDPVTLADTEAQESLVKAIHDKYPNHDVVGEEDKNNDGNISDLVWVIDPLDGTRNFLNGFPIYASSIGLLFQGEPVAGALYIPWPNSKGHLIISAVKGMGVTINDQKYINDIAAEFNSSGIITLPGSFDKRFKFSKEFKGHSGELRMGGSIAYELSLLVLGISQYAVISSSHIWDVAGAIPILFESGYAIKQISRRGYRYTWQSFDSFNNLANNPKYEDYRTRIDPILVSPINQIEYLSKNIEIKNSSFATLMKSIIK
tara:strand:+ start:680 stop:1609 length:930 start_codon:yes stop_codon:yes gene_type:complete